MHVVPGAPATAVTSPDPNIRSQDLSRSLQRLGEQDRGCAVLLSTELAAQTGCIAQVLRAITFLLRMVGVWMPLTNMGCFYHK